MIEELAADRAADGLRHHPKLATVLLIEVVIGLVVMLFCGVAGFLMALEAEHYGLIFGSWTLIGGLSFLVPVVILAIWANRPTLLGRRPAIAALMGAAPSAVGLVGIAVLFAHLS